MTRPQEIRSEIELREEIIKLHKELIMKLYEELHREEYREVEDGFHNEDVGG